MDTFLTLFLALSGAVLVTLVTNLLQLEKETRQLKAAGKTPLHGRNIVVICLAAVAEVLVCYLLVQLYMLVDLKQTGVVVLIEFVLAYLLRNVGAYLVAWGLWAIFIRIDKKKLLKQIEQEKAEAL
jgi:uncharacterized membrane protein